MPRPASSVVTSKPARFVLALLRIAVEIGRASCRERV